MGTGGRRSFGPLALAIGLALGTAHAEPAPCPGTEIARVSVDVEPGRARTDVRQLSLDEPAAAPVCMSYECSAAAGVVSIVTLGAAGDPGVVVAAAECSPFAIGDGVTTNGLPAGDYAAVFTIFGSSPSSPGRATLALYGMR